MFSKTVKQIARDNPYEKYNLSNTEMGELYKLGRKAKKEKNKQLYLECRDKILYSLARWAYYMICTRYPQYTNNIDDIVQNFLIQCIKNYKNYRSRRGAVSTYFGWKLHSVISMYLARYAKQKKQEEAALDILNRTYRSKILRDSNKDDFIYEYNLIRHKLRDRERVIFEMFVFDGLDYVNIGKKFNLTKERIRQINNRTIIDVHSYILYGRPGKKHDSRKSWRNHTTIEQ